MCVKNHYDLFGMHCIIVIMKTMITSTIIIAFITMISTTTSKWQKVINVIFIYCFLLLIKCYPRLFQPTFELTHDNFGGSSGYIALLIFFNYIRIYSDRNSYSLMWNNYIFIFWCFIIIWIPNELKNFLLNRIYNDEIN